MRAIERGRCFSKTIIALVALLTAALSVAAAEPDVPIGDSDGLLRARAVELVERARHRFRGGTNEGFAERYPRSLWTVRAADAARMTNCLAERFGLHLDDATLLRELRRIRATTLQPERLNRIEIDLGGDPALIEEGLIRPSLARRLLHRRTAWDDEIQAPPRRIAAELAGRMERGLGGGELGVEVIRFEVSLGERVVNTVYDRASETYRRELPEEEFSRFADERRDRIGTAVFTEDEQRISIEVIEGFDDDSVRLLRAHVAKVAWDEWWATVRADYSEELTPRHRTTGREPAAPDGSVTVGSRRSAGAGRRTVEPYSGSWEVQADPLAGRERHAAVWTGSEMIVFGGDADVPDPTPLRYDPLTDSWSRGSSASAPSPRPDPSAVWTGTEMLVWGGDTGLGGVTAGGRYDPVLDLWTPMSTVGAPGDSADHTAVWTGEELLVWGGDPMGRAAYDPASDTWRIISSVGAPGDRSQHSAVWTGTEMLVWGGLLAGGALTQDGGRYDPVSDSWAPLSGPGAPAARRSHHAAWTGSEMIIWGGEDDQGFVEAGGRYRPAHQLWVSMATAYGPTFRVEASSVWTGDRFIVWGGHRLTPGEEPLASGDAYRPAGNSWTSVTELGAPVGRWDHCAVWTGSEMLVWGGRRVGLLSSGGRFDPIADEWSVIDPAGGPSQRIDHTATWTGAEMVVFGGENDGQALDDGSIYDPVLNAWETTPTLNAPSPRYGHGEAWTGTEVVIWGGASETQQGEAFTGTGRRFDPVSREWAVIPSNSGPSARADAVLLWSGPYGLFVWGGRDDDGYPVTGGFYFPHLDEWHATDTIGSSYGRADAAGVWTGRELVVYGGQVGGGGRDDGVRYDPVFNTISPLSGSSVADHRWGHTAVWTEREMVVFGGSYTTSSWFEPPAAFDLSTGAWRPLDGPGSLDLRRDHSSVWTGDEMIVWGGRYGGPLASGLRWEEATDTWRELATDGAPPAGWHHTAVWTGEKMIVWGGTAGRKLAVWSPIVEPEIAGPPSICLGDVATLEVAEGYDSYLWSPGGHTGRQIQVSPNETTVYRVDVTAGTMSASATRELIVGIDMDGDGAADEADLELLAASFFGGGSVQCPDVDDNGDSDAADLARWLVLFDPE